ncbi:hypothetical protein Chor_010762 [Crotalus horridus]
MSTINESQSPGLSVLHLKDGALVLQEEPWRIRLGRKNPGSPATEQMTGVSGHKKETSWSREPHLLWTCVAEEPRMEGYFWKTLLVLGALSASGRGEPSHKPLTYQKALELGVANYNNKAGEDLLYQLLEAVPQPEWDPNSEGTQELKFTIKETVCPVEEGRALEECDFKEDGVSDERQAGLGGLVVRECTGNYFLGEKPPLAFVTCDAVEGIEEEEEVEEEKEKKDEDEEEEEEVEEKKANVV